MHVRVDEGRGEDEAGAVEHPVPVDREVRPKLGDHALVDPDVDLAVDALDRVEDARAPNDEVLLRSVLDVEHHATSIGTSALTGFGPVVSRS